jgi:lysophospholipase L1-like esterase
LGQGFRLIAVIALSGLTAACGGSPSASPSTSASSTTSTSSRAWSIVALGDSVPSGYHCNCTPYPQLSAAGLTSTTGQTVTATNDAVAGYTTANVLKQLDSDSAVIDHVRKADAIEINVGANDVPYNANTCGTSTACYAPLVAPMQKNLAAIVSRAHDLVSGHKVLVVLLDYWSIWQGGTYAREKGNAYVRAAREMTAQVDAAIKSTASQSGSAYVSERRAFKGPSFGYIESHYLATDGDHPNAAGHQAIAKAAQTVIEKTLHS